MAVLERQRPAGIATRTSAIVALDRLSSIDSAQWDALAADPSEPNAFGERWFVMPSASLAAPADVRMIVVRQSDAVIGLMPIHIVERYGRMPVRHVENWLHFNCFLGTPLVRAGYETAFWRSALEVLDADRASPAFLHVTALDEAGPLAAALQALRGASVVHRSERAMLNSTLSPVAYYETTVRKKKRKEIARLQARLAELGTVTCHRWSAGSALLPWTDAFLKLEASGWKGRGGAALANDAATEGFTRAALAGAAAAGRLEILRLDLDDRAIAMLINFRTPPGSFSWKIAFDENYARFSPGVLIQIENLQLLADPAIDWMDSCAAPDHPMINSLWGERRALVRITVPLHGLRRRATFTACRALEDGSAWTRRWR